MNATYRVLSHRDLEQAGSLQRRFSLDVLLGLARSDKQLSSKHFYDAEGSRLFSAIMELESYYPTRCEHAILERNRGDLVDLLVDQPFDLLELGSGDGRKTNLILDTLLAEGLDFVYRPIDISEAAISAQAAALTARFPTLRSEGIVAEYLDGLTWHAHRAVGRRTMLLFLGSNIGNFRPAEAGAFLRSVWSLLREDDLLLIGFDLKKHIPTMVRAYSDPDGVTAAFNLNLLGRINRELGGDFDPARFAHHATYNVSSGAMESHLVSLERQRVHLRELDHGFDFEPFEPIHTEYSYKFLDTEIRELAARTGYSVEAMWYDERRWFVDALFEVRRRSS